jgi:hypothetical protein
MLDAKLIFDGREKLVESDVTTIGRVSDNDVAFPEDSNVSRYHAEIERRGGDHWLIDLRSSNGTTVNGTPVDGEIRLTPGDLIVLGGSSKVEFVSAEEASPDNAGEEIAGLSEARSEIGSLGNEAESEVAEAARDALTGVSGQAAHGAAPAVAAGSGSNSTVLIAGAVAGLAIVCAVAAGAFYLTRGSACAARAAIVKPEPGETIISPVDIQVETQNAGCAQRAIFTIDGQEVASADAPSFSATLDPKDVPELADGADHVLQIVLIDETGQRIAQAGSVMVAFETRALTKASPTPDTASNKQAVKKTGAGQLSLFQINDMAQKLVKQFSGNFAYNVSNKQFLDEVQKRTADYAQDGYWQRASAYRDTINVAFVREQNIDAPLGFVLAMSRSKFIAAKQGDAEGLWQMTGTFVADNKYNGQCGTETLSDKAQVCAAKSAALYMKALIYGVFDGDVIYSAAAFGKSPQDAAAWKSTLPKNRLDVGNSIKTPAEREQLIRFFAAGIVAENPQAFGLANDRPLSELYRVTM